jgi:hypothetical protein
MEAELVRVDGEKVILKNKEGREITVPKLQLSISDNRYLAEFAPKATAPALGQSTAKPVLPNPGKDVKIDQKSFIKVKDKQFTIPECKFDILETPHFLVLYPNKVEATDIGETAERIWLDAAFFQPGLAQKFKDRRMAIFMVEEQDTWENIGEWYAKMIETSSAPNAADIANQQRATWAKAASGAINLTQEVADEHGVLRHARVFRTTTGAGTDKKREKIKGVFVPFRLHCLASDMLDINTGGVQGFGSNGLFAISTGHAYYKEILLGGRSETSMLSAAGTDNSVSSAGGFDPSKNWADEIKKQLRGSKPVLIPDILKLYEVKKGGDQKSNVLAYGFSRYLQGTPDRAIIYAKLLEKIDTGSQIPDAVELAKLYGFADVAAMQADWIAYMKSPEFK